MKLTTPHKTWLLYNIRNFIRKDLYLRYLDSDILIQEIKKQLKENHSLKDICNNLPQEYKRSFRFHRKSDMFFIYPSIEFQLKSLVNCWKEIIEIKKTLNTEIKNFKPGHKAEEPDFEINEELVHDEIPYYIRDCFGQSASLTSQFKQEIPGKLKTHILSKITYIQVDYQKEYSKFRKRIIKTASKITHKGYSAFILQTDIKSFYHKINTLDIIRILEKKFPNTSKQLTESIRLLRKHCKSAELPIGWILSGPVADIILNIIHLEILKNKNADTHYISYVDDFVIINENAKEEKIDSLMKENFKDLENAFKTVLPRSKIEFHKEGDKVKKLFIEANAPGILDLNFFNFENTSLDPDPEFRWNGVSEFLLEADNDLTTNEKVQFLENLKKIKEKILNDEIKTWDEFSDYFNKIIYKLTTSGVKYIPSIVDLILTFSRSNSIQDQETIIRLNSIATELRKNMASANIWLSFLSIIKNHSSSVELIEWIQSQCLYVIKQYEFKKQEHDKELIHAWILLFISPKQNSTKLIDELAHVSFKSEFFLNEVRKNFFFEESQEAIKKLGINIENEWFIANYIRYQAYRDPESVMDCIVTISKIISTQTLSNYILEGLHTVSNFLTIDDIRELYRIICEDGGKESSPGQLLENLTHSFDDATKFIYELGPGEKIKFLRIQISRVNSHKPSSIPYIRSIQQNDIHIGMPQILITLLHLSNNIDNWKRIFLVKESTFDFANYISPVFFPEIFPEFSLPLLDSLKKVLSIKTSSILKRKCTPEELKEVREAFIFKDLEIIGENIVIQDAKNYSYGDLSRNKTIITIASTAFDIEKDWIPKNNFGHSEKTVIDLKKKIHQAITHAIKTRSNILIFPELCIPKKELINLLTKAASHNIVVIAGLETCTDSLKKYRNSTVISFPISPRLNAIPQNYVAYYQHKNYPAASEEHGLKIEGYEYVSGKSIFLFKDSPFGDFSVLTCSDFLTTSFKYYLKGKIQSLFIPAINKDNNTYSAVSESSARELYCYCIVCNNSEKGSSHVIGPYNKPHKRLIYSIHGKSSPSIGTIQIDIDSLKSMQSLTPIAIEEIRQDKDHTLFQLVDDFKQLPPDWNKFKLKT